MSNIVEKLTENIVDRDLQKEGAALLTKWEKTGLLEGLNSDIHKNSMARLLENQAKELLREASVMSGGDVEGFAAVAFPIVRRVFGGLIANDLVSVQPMSLPSGLIFFLDFTYADSAMKHAGAVAGKSVYGGNAVGSEIATSGVDLEDTYHAGTLSGETSFYALNQSYSSPTGSAPSGSTTQLAHTTETSLRGAKTVAQLRSLLEAGSLSTVVERDVANRVAYDPDLNEGHFIKVLKLADGIKNDGSGGLTDADFNNLIAISGNLSDNTSEIGSATRTGGVGALCVVGGTAADTRQVRRLTTRPKGTNDLYFVFTNAAAMVSVADADTGFGLGFQYARKDDYSQGNAVGSVEADLIGLEGAGDGENKINSVTGENTTIRELDIKVDSLAVTAQTKKLKAKWTPELGQDLNAYHNLDAEVELTSILSEHVALEIDREILEDLVKGATASTLHWSRHAGKFLNRVTGKEVGATTAAPDFTGTVSEWYETLIETINDVSAQIHRKTLRGGANFIVCSPEVANILEFTAGFRASVTADADRGSVGAVKVGSISKKFDAYVDPYFPRNVILVGRKGSSFLESGYVYAPYVPLQVTPTIFGPEDFVPRKGVMTRYAKRMVRSDMYGLVICHDLVG